ncbi:hypothetical protein MKW92_031601 [Papaver armeniacum]|nr:hypothetical protein MKW92_031601 [Papaver armeniacum]
MDNQSPISTEEPASTQEVRNWVELPLDVLSKIFLKLGAADILCRAQSVCSTWRKISKDPMLFRSIDMRWNLYEYDIYDMEIMAAEAVDRSCGQLVELFLERFCRDQLLTYIADRCSSLRHLRLVSCQEVSFDALIKVVEKAVLLEELELCYCSFSGDKVDVLRTIGKACRQLKSFRLNCRGYRWRRVECDDEALAIAENMPQLRRLHLFGSKLTNVGLGAILNGCLHLESLDLRQCFNVNLEGDVLKSCTDRLIELRLPNDSVADYEFDATLLPPDVLSHIFLKLGVIDILLRAQLVCSVWRKASKEPLLFRSIDTANTWDLYEMDEYYMMAGSVSFNGNRYDMRKMVREAVDRSCGQLVDFSLERFCCDELLAYCEHGNRA